MNEHSPTAQGGPDPAIGSARRFVLNDDWAATVVGLVLLALILAGVVPGRLVP